MAICSAALLGLRCGSDRTCEPEVPRYGVFPDSTAVEVSSSRQFTVVFETGPTHVAWYVDGLLGGKPSTGMIMQTGLYIAPAEAPAGGEVIVSARSADDSTIQANAKVVLTGDGQAPRIEVAPNLVTVPVSDSIAFEATISGCPPGVVAWSIAPVCGNPAQIGTITGSGLYAAPSSPGEDLILMVAAHSGGCSGKTGLARIVVKQPRRFWAECEDFADSSGTGITRNVTCAGGLGVTGLDQPGEWISIAVDVPAAGRYLVKLHYAAGVQDVLTLTLAAGCGGEASSPEVSFVLNQGTGVGG